MKKVILSLVLAVIFADGGSPVYAVLGLLSPAHQKTANRIALPPQPDLLEQVLVYNNRGISRLEQYDYRQAVQEFRKALDLKPDFVPALVNLGIAHYYDSDYQQAAERLRAVLELEPGQPHAHFMLGLLFSKEYKKDEALREFELVAKAFPEDSATNYNLGLTLMRAREYERALAYFEKVLRTEPRHMSAMYNLGMALMRAGRREEAQKVMARLRELKGEDQGGNPMGAMGTQYQDEGRFAIAIGEYDIPRTQDADTGPAVRFVDVTRSTGIKFVHAAGPPGGAGGAVERDLKASAYSRAWAEKELVPALGSGAAFIDYDNDGKLDLYLVNCGPDGKAANALYRNQGGGTFADVTARAGVGIAGYGMGVAAGDYNNDGWTDLYITRYGRNILLRNEKDGKFSDVTEAAGVAGTDSEWSLSAAFFDYDHDGDLDLYVCNFLDLAAVPSRPAFRFTEDFEGQPNRLYRNNGNGTFFETGGPARVDGGKTKSTGLVFLDFNESRDIDFCLVDYRAPLRLFSNNRDGSFTDVAARVNLGGHPAQFGIGAGDLNKDGYPDLYVPAADGRAGGRVLFNQAGRTFREVLAGAPDPDGRADGKSWGSAVLDYDNDGDLDILGIGRGVYLLRNDGRGEFRDASADTGLARLGLKSARSAALGDYDADGDTDILITQNGGMPLLIRNDGGNDNNFLRIDLTALSDNKPGIGSKVEIRSGALWQKVDVTGNCGFLSQGAPGLILGLGARKTVDAVRIIWPTGVLQSEIEPQANGRLQIQQIDRKGTSCPILYAWNGAAYEFITDFLGGSAFGNKIAPDRYNTTDTDEYILVTSSQLQARDGAYSIKMNNQLEEVILIDQARLLAVDHPAGTTVYPNERLLPAPPFPGYRLIVARDPRPPVKAVDGEGRDVRAKILEIDRTYPDDFALLPFKGYAETHALILDPGEIGNSEKVVLLMHAWIDYADSTSNLAASQAGVNLVPPTLQVLDDKGRWVTAIENMGFPAGLPKTMTVDLTGRFRNAKDRRVKIVTNMRIYWDRILVSTDSGQERIRTVDLGLRAGALCFGGYPREVTPDSRKPKLYDYGHRSQTSPWKSHAGAYTRYGDVSELLRGSDNKYVIMRHGDEITLDFDAAAAPPPGPGWTRSYLVYASGFGKDMDLNSAFPDTVEPLPFHGMPGYPYRTPFPRSQRWTEYHREYNTRIVPGIYFGNGDLRGEGGSGVDRYVVPSGSGSADRRK